MPPQGTLKRCAEANPDGFGFATKDRVFKTLSYKEFCRELKTISKDEAAILHFRYATHGSIKKDNCHPFRDSKTGISFAHNGVLSIVPYKDMTDSETAFRGLFVPTIREHGLYSDELCEKVFSIIGGSRFAFIDKDGETRLFGRFTKHLDYWFSNLNWMPYTERYTAHHKYAY